MSKNVLIVEDDKAIQNLLKMSLKDEDYNITLVSKAEDAINTCIKNIVDIVLLDLGLPDKDGMYVIEKIREWNESLPIIVISARSSDDDKVLALDKGANDYIQKPFSAVELLARMRVCLRSVAHKEDNVIFTNGHLTIDFSSHSVYLNGQEVHFTNYEYKVLALLAQNVGKTLTHSFIISKVWGVGGNDSNGLRVFMANIRRKVEMSPLSQDIIRTDVGVGYRMNKI